LGSRQEVTAGAVSGGDSAEVRVHLYERSFPEEPDRRARTVNVNAMCTALDVGAAFGGVTGIAPSRRMIVTCMWGVSDPLRAVAWGEEGGSPMGVAHAPLAALRDYDSGADGRPAAQSAAGVWLLNLQAVKNMAVAYFRHWSKRARGCSARPVAQSGERCSRDSVPPTCSPF
jgi:hypothetical protein